MTDMFLDALTATPVKRHNYGSSIGVGPAMRPTNPHPDSPMGRVVPPKPVQAPLITPDAKARPDYADEIDAMVRALETAGDIVFDGEAQAYRRPHCRRYRFTMGE